MTAETCWKLELCKPGHNSSVTFLCHCRFVTPVPPEHQHHRWKGLSAALGDSLAWGQSSGRAGSATLRFPGLTGTRGGAGQRWEDAPHQNLSHNELEQHFGWGHRHRWEIFTVGVSHLSSSMFNTGAAGGCWKRPSPRLIILRNSDRCWRV